MSTTHTWIRGVVAAVFVAGLPAAALAQSPGVEVTVAVLADGGASSGTTRAELLDPSGNPFVLFEASHRTTRSVGGEVGLGFRLASAWLVEVAGSWSRPSLESRIANDFEGVEEQTASMRLDRFALGVAAVRRFGDGRATPYATAGVRWLRDLTDDRALVDDGLAAHAGAGLKYGLRTGRPGWLGHIALRAEARVTMRRGGLTVGEAGTRWSPSLLAGLVIAR